MQKWIILLILSLFSLATRAQAVDNSDVKNTCEISGGAWTESANGNWACCWDDWGCYGCVNGICKIKCHNQRCRDANKIRVNTTPAKNYQRIEGLAPAGKIAPVVPKPKKIKAPTVNSAVH